MTINAEYANIALSPKKVLFNVGSERIDEIPH